MNALTRAGYSGFGINEKGLSRYTPFEDTGARMATRSSGCLKIGFILSFCRRTRHQVLYFNLFHSIVKEIVHTQDIIWACLRRMLHLSCDTSRVTCSSCAMIRQRFCEAPTNDIGNHAGENRKANIYIHIYLYACNFLRFGSVSDSVSRQCCINNVGPVSTMTKHLRRRWTLDVMS